MENYNEINVNKNKESTKVSKENQKVYKNPTNFIDDNKVDTTVRSFVCNYGSLC